MKDAGHPKQAQLARTYAQAAYQYTTEGWLDNLRNVWTRLVATPGLLEDLVNTGKPFSERQAQLDDVLPSDIPADVKNYVYVLLRDGHVEMLGDVIKDMERLMTRGPGVQVAYVTSAVPLTPDEQDDFRQRIKNTYGSFVDMVFQVDASILGGVIVQVGDKVIDGSIAAKLDSLHDRLKAVR